MSKRSRADNRGVFYNKVPHSEKQSQSKMPDECTVNQEADYTSKGAEAVEQSGKTNRTEKSEKTVIIEIRPGRK